MIIPEVLSPAGSWETLKAAVQTGADAVYFGGHSFNARRNADNFDDTAISEAVKYCHERGVKAYITLNTLIYNNEIKTALDFAKLACEAGADALILQDVGLAGLIKNAEPEIKLHASTQMSLHNAEGVNEAVKHGFSRVVLARELSKDEIEQIRASVNCELEVFVHGALCMSVSGQCYMSSVLGCRSGNRGLCAQPCRLPFSVESGTERDLSLKDMSLIENINELAEMGINSLKIEGRMKRPEYVAAATYVCRKAARGEEVTKQELDDLQAVFSRSGFTKGYYNSILGREMFGFRQYEDVIASQKVLKGLKSLYEGTEKPRVGVSFKFIMETGKNIYLYAKDQDGNEAAAQGEVPDIAKNIEIGDEFVKDKLSKTGGTPFYVSEITCSISHGLLISVSALKSLRRKVLDEILEKRAKTSKIEFKSIALPFFSTQSVKIVEKKLQYRIRLQSFEQMTDKVTKSNAHIIFLPVKELIKNPDTVKYCINKSIILGAELPRAVFYKNISELNKNLSELLNLKINKALCSNLGTLEIAKKAGFEAYCDFGLNITNPYSFNEYLNMGAESCVLSFEQNLEQIKSTAAANQQKAGIIIYGRLPLMLTRNCPLKNGSGCASCNRNAGITDRNGESFPIICDGICSQILNTRPLWMFDRLNEVKKTGVQFADLIFTTENETQVDQVIDSMINERQCNTEFTRGLYYRSVE